jgi:hypothetical protein
MNHSRNFRYKPYNNNYKNLRHLTNPYDVKTKENKDTVLILSDGTINGIKPLEIDFVETIVIKTVNTTVTDFYKLIENNESLNCIYFFLI